MPILPGILRTPLKRPTYVLTRFLFASATVIFVNDNVIEVTSVTGKSMAPTLSPDYSTTGAEDIVLWRKWNPTRKLQRGELVHFDNPSKPEAFAVKRVIALEGDTVVLNKQRRPRSNEGREPIEAASWDAWKGRALVPPGHVWVEGDNVGSSKDSNDYGPISRSLINGRAIALFWPLSKFGTRPWDGFQPTTRVIDSREVRDWTLEGLPIEVGASLAAERPP